MDRPEPGLVKWSANPQVDSFVHVNLQRQIVQLYEPTGHARNGQFDYAKSGKHDDFPPLTTYDWSPCDPRLLAVGTGAGMVNLLRVDDGSNAYLELGVKMARTCHAVAFNTTGLLAVGLDRVRMDSSLQVWDLERLSAIDISLRGFPPDALNYVDAKVRLEPSVSISSIKFFEDSPQTLVAGIKSQGLRIHDLRSPTNATTFQTKCNNNLAIDYADQNYFASSALDHPGVVIWDRRATSRPVASHSYLQAVDDDDVPWGGALRLDRAIEADIDPNSIDNKHSLIRSLRYCREQRGLLAVLSRTGQLKVLETNKEIPSSDMAIQEGPELVQVQTSHEMDVSYREASNKNDRIVSFDWATLGSPGLRPRLLVLKTNGSFGILEQPSRTADQVYKLVPWQAPHRGLDSGAPYQDIMQFHETEAAEILAPIRTQHALDSTPLFGIPKSRIATNVASQLKSIVSPNLEVEHLDQISPHLPDDFHSATTVAGKLRSIRHFLQKESSADESTTDGKNVRSLRKGDGNLSLASNSLESCREFHEALLGTLISEGLPREAQGIVDHTMLLRAKERYLFDATLNRNIVADDPWKRYLWDWVADAEEAAEDGALILSGSNLSYLGIQSIWTNNFGRIPALRLEPGMTLPDTQQLERSIAVYCKKRHLRKFDAVTTKKPYHRQLCLEICGWGDAERHDPKGLDRQAVSKYPTAVHTMAACRALFKGDTARAIEILKKASSSHPELLFVSLALQLVGRGNSQLAKEQLDFDETVASKTDPYLRAISSLIATGDWSTIANQRTLPLADRVYAAVRNFTDDQLTAWLNQQVEYAIQEGDIEGIVLTGITDSLVDIFARYVQKFQDYQTATLVLSICYPRFIDDIRCDAWRNAYRAHLQRHKLFFQRTKFEVESTKRSKRDGIPTLKPPSRQIALRCVFCDAETTLSNQHGNGTSSNAPRPVSSAMEMRNPLLATSINAGVSCPNCGRHLPRCVVCLEVVGVPRSDKPEEKEETKMAGRFPTFCLRCDHVLHLDHARQWFARHSECPVPECRCRCNFRANAELNYS